MTETTHRTTTEAADAPAVGVAPPGYRLPDELSLGAVHLQVADLAPSLTFYERVLGLRRLETNANGATLGAAGDDRPLVQLTERRGAAAVPPKGLQGLYHFAILLPDRPALGRFVAHLSEIGTRFGASDHLVSEAVYLRDPDGLGIEVYADRPRSSWRAVSREIRMTTEPLDLVAIVDAGGGERWMGMPDGTRVGHIHLHVGDLDQASRFYHDALGLDRMVWSYPGALFLAAGGYHHHLGLNTWAGASARSADESDARLVEWQIVLPGSHVASARRSVEGAGYAVSDTEVGWRTTDPWGTTVHVVARNSRSGAR